MKNQYTCINDLFSAKQLEQGWTNLPVKDETYTLKEEVKSPIDGKVGLVFYELPNPHHPNGQEFSFRPSRFIKAENIYYSGNIRIRIRKQLNNKLCH